MRVLEVLALFGLRSREERRIWRRSRLRAEPAGEEEARERRGVVMAPTLVCEIVWLLKVKDHGRYRVLAREWYHLRHCRLK